MEKKRFKVKCKKDVAFFNFEQNKEYTAEMRKRSIGVLHEGQRTWFNFYRSDVELPEDERLSPKFVDYFEYSEEVLSEINCCVNEPNYFIENYVKIKEYEK